MEPRLPLGKLLVSYHMITEEQLAAGLKEQQTGGGKLGQVLIRLGYIEEKKLLHFLADRLKLPFIDLEHYSLKQELVRRLPEANARRLKALVLETTKGGLLVGMVDPQDIVTVDELTRILRMPLRLALLSETQLTNTFDLAYRHFDEISAFVGELSAELQEGDIDLKESIGGGDVSADEAPVVKLLQSLFQDALQVGASDIHIEPEENILRIRMRIDGVLQEHLIDQVRIAPALIQRLKLMARVNIAERRMPQDGRFSIKVKGSSYDVRLATLPTAGGEAVVMRLLTNSVANLSLNEIGLPPEMLNSLRRIMAMPYGMILVSGPTGSGKTTTLYGMLNELNSSNTKIITAEDPVEYRLPRINQVQVNPKINLSFAAILRSMLRHDPDVIMVGEIRDSETTSIALRAAITGHLVLATIHTNDAISSAMRLLDLESEGYMVAEAVRAVIAQRLVRRICLNCKTDYEPTPAELSWLEAMKVDLQTIQLKHGPGCTQCGGTGYKGRIGIFELLEFTEAMGQPLRHDDTTGFVKAVQQTGYQKLSETAMEHIAKGVTTISEVRRATIVNM